MESASTVTRARWKPVAIGAGLVLILSVPLLVALGFLAHPRWIPGLDLAQTEMRVRDVFSAHPPLVGTAGRITGADGGQGSHPGPLGFWLMAPFYRLFGGSSWALQVSAVCVQMLGIAAALWVAYRRGAMRLMLAVATALAVLIAAFGTGALTQAWNPYLPVLWWLVFVLAVWSVLCDDLAMLPVVAFVGSFCLQEHLLYGAAVLGLVALAVGVAAWRAFRGPHASPSVRRSLLRWGAIAVGVGVVLWLPPVIQQLTQDRGNLSVLWFYVRNPTDEPLGIGRGLEQFFLYVDPWRLLTWRPVTEQRAASGSVVPGAVLVVAWAASAFVAWRMKARRLTLLNATLGVALLLGAVSASRIFGELFFYLLLWLWGIAALMLLAIAWCGAVIVRERVGQPARDRLFQAGAVAAGVIAVVSLAVSAVDASTVEVPTPRVSSELRHVIGPTVGALDSQGRDGRYLLTWTYSLTGDDRGFAMLNELDRDGFDVGVVPALREGATRHRIIEDPDAVQGEVHLAIGPDIAKWRAMPDAREVTAYDPRTPSEQREYDRLRTEVKERLRAAGLDDLIDDVDRVPSTVAFDKRVPDGVRTRASRMLRIGEPLAVFVAPHAVDS